MPPRKTPRKSSPAVVPPKVRRLTIRHLREIHAGVTPCPQTQAHIRVLPVVRARQMLQSVAPLLAEHSDGTMEPRGYASTIAALLQVVSPEEQVWCLVHPSASAPRACPIPLVLEFDHRIEDDALIAFTQKLIAHWRSLGVAHIPKETIASELSLSATTYCRKIGLTYDAVNAFDPDKEVDQDAPDESNSDWPTDAPSYEDEFPNDMFAAQ